MGTREILMWNPEMLEQILPQRPPIVMIGELLRSDDECTVTRFLIPPDNIFCEHGFLTEPGLVENMAQTAAARAGYAALVAGVEAPLCFIGAVEDLAISELPQADTEINTTVHVTHTILNITRVNATVRSMDHIIARCALKIAVANPIMEP